MDRENDINTRASVGDYIENVQRVPVAQTPYARVIILRYDFISYTRINYIYIHYIKYIVSSFDAHAGIYRPLSIDRRSFKIPLCVFFFFQRANYNVRISVITRAVHIFKTYNTHVFFFLKHITYGYIYIIHFFSRRFILVCGGAKDRCSPY